MANSERVLIVAPNWLGDAVMALPAIADVRRHFATRHLTVAARRSIAPLFSLVDGVDEVVELPGRGGIGAIATWKSDSAVLAAGGYATAVLFPNSFAAAWVVSRAGIAERWGFGTDWRRRLLTRAVPKARGLMHQASYYQALVAGLGIPNGPLNARVRVDGESSGPATRARQLLDGSGIDASRRYVTFAPGAAYGKAKQWLTRRFGELAALLVRERGWSVVLVGSKAETALCDEVVRESGLPPTDRPSVVSLAGQTDLPALAGVLALARAVVSNDSGVMHLAGAIGVPVVAIFGATNEHRTAPLVPGPDSVAPAIVTHPVFCRPCMLRECPIDHRCMREITARRVFHTLVQFPELDPPQLGGRPASEGLAPPELERRRASEGGRNANSE